MYLLKVALAGDKRVWRRIAIRGNQTLDDLHEAIYDAFDRYDEHLYSFYLPPPGSRGRGRLRDAPEYTHPFNLAEGPFDDWSDLPPRHDASKTGVDSLGLNRGRKFDYLFDFGDEWWHEITVEATDAEAEPGRYPRVLEKHGDSPPQYPDVEDEGGEDGGEQTG